MNWKDIQRSLDSEFTRLEDERNRQVKEDEKLADLIAKKELDEELKWLEKRREWDKRLVNTFSDESLRWMEEKELERGDYD